MTIEEIEQACDAGLATDFSRHPLEAPQLTLEATFYPFGFPTLLRTNAPEILTYARELWSMWEKRFDTSPIRVEVQVVDGDSEECPPTPSFHMMLPLLANIADGNNLSIVNLAQSTTHITITRATVQYPRYVKHFFLDAAPQGHIATRYTTPVHAGCVTLEGHGLLLCGDSGAGKSSLSYACARAGFTYTTDDASFILHHDPAIHPGQALQVTGNCYQVRFRPTASELFPEIDGLELTPRAAGKPSIELPTGPMPHVTSAQTTEVRSLVFLNRRAAGPPELRPYRKDVARHSLRQVHFGSPESLAVQYQEIERILNANIFELRYTDINWAVDRLKKFIREGK